MRKSSALVFAVSVHLARFLVILGGSLAAPLIGITGWYVGLFVNLLCALFAAVLITVLRLWRSTGFLTLWRGRGPALLLVVPLVEALSWLWPGVQERPPGFGLWALTLLLVGFNEELVSRGVVLDRLRRSFSASPAVGLTAVLFGLQHLSLLLTTTRGTVDVLTNVLASACYGFALAAFQYRFSWIWPLILIHGLADFSTLMSRDPFGDMVIAAWSVMFVGYGAVLLARRPKQLLAV